MADDEYLKGNTPEAASEWSFDFVASHADDNRKIPAAKMDVFWDRVLDAAEEHELVIGGGFRPITDADYEKMTAKEEPVCICPSYPFEPEGEEDESDLCPVHGGKR